MELALSLGDSSKPFPSLYKSRKMSSGNMDLGFCMGLAAGSTSSSNNNEDDEDQERRSSSDPPPLQQLDLLPASSVAVSVPVPVRHLQMNKQLQWLTPSLMSVSPTNSCSEGVGKSYQVMSSSRVLKRKPLAVVEEAEDDQSSPNSTSSSFQHLDFSIYRKCFSGGEGSYNNSKRPWEYHKDTTRIGDGDTEEANNRGGGGDGGSDDEDNGLTRKKLRLSKDQSAFLEESFKEHNTLTPKQKIALAKELNLRPRQVEVWFQNRRARTKLKQTEVDCEYLKRCCETLTEENRRLQKELQELRALKTSQPFCMQLPATTLTMCPSCERVTSSSATPTATASTTSNKQPQHPSLTSNTTASPTTNSTVGETVLALAPPPPPSSSNNNNNTLSSSSSSKLFPFLAAHAQQVNAHQTRGHQAPS